MPREGLLLSSPSVSSKASIRNTLSILHHIPQPAYRKDIRPTPDQASFPSMEPDRTAPASAPKTGHVVPLRQPQALDIPHETSGSDPLTADSKCRRSSRNTRQPCPV